MSKELITNEPILEAVTTAPVTLENYTQLELTHNQRKILKTAKKGRMLEYTPPVPCDISILAYYGLLDCTDPKLDYHRPSKETASFLTT